MRVADLNVYPVKSTRPQRRDRVAVEPWGLADDRRWMVVDADGRFVTARKFPALLGVTATPVGPGRLQLEGPHANSIEVDANTSVERIPVRVWNSDVLAARPDGAADAWFSKLLGFDTRLVWLDDPTCRAVNPDYGRPDDRVTFADAFPLLLTTTGSLRQLNDWIIEEAVDRDDPTPDRLSMMRFRPNVVIETEEPFTEDRWSRIRIGPIDFRVARLCARCTLTTIDPVTQVKGKEPLRTLARHRRWEGNVWFGVNLVPDGVGTIGVRDNVSPQ